VVSNYKNLALDFDKIAPYIELLAPGSAPSSGLIDFSRTRRARRFEISAHAVADNIPGGPGFEAKRKFCEFASRARRCPQGRAPN
jgi:hypothetical protein